jgi:hypothetical protein
MLLWPQVKKHFQSEEDKLFDEVQVRRQRSDWTGIELATDGQFDSSRFSAQAIDSPLRKT